VRKIEKFALFHIFADIMIMAALIVITYFAIVTLKGHDWNFGPDIVAVNTSSFLSFIGNFKSQS
jgi:hypothetical protein